MQNSPNEFEANASTSHGSFLWSMSDGACKKPFMARPKIDPLNPPPKKTTSDRRTCATCLSYPMPGLTQSRVCLFVGRSTPEKVPRSMPCKGDCHATRVGIDGRINEQ